MSITLQYLVHSYNIESQNSFITIPEFRVQQIKQ
jgi:hypothetical protein